MSGDGPKIEYQLLNGFTSDAYLDDEIPEGREILTGVDKHTDRRITVRATDDHWVQIPDREAVLDAMLAHIYEGTSIPLIRQGMPSQEWTLLSLAADAVVALFRRSDPGSMSPDKRVPTER